MLVSIFISSSYADVTNTHITKVAVRKSGMVYIKTNPAPTSRPDCATNKFWHYAFKIDDAGKGMLSLALTAHTSNALIQIQSLETCNNFHNMENVDYIILLEKA